MVGRIGIKINSNQYQMKAFIGRIGKLERGMKNASRTISYDMAKGLKRQIGIQMKKLTPYNSINHNTKIHLSRDWMKFVSFKQSTKSFEKDVRILTIRSIGSGSNKMNPLWVDRGTSPHTQLNNPYHSKEGHPGSKRNPFIERGFIQFKRVELPKIVKKAGKLIKGSENAYGSLSEI